MMRISAASEIIQICISVVVATCGEERKKCAVVRIIHAAVLGHPKHIFIWIFHQISDGRCPFSGAAIEMMNGKKLRRSLRLQPQRGGQCKQNKREQFQFSFYRG